MSTIALALISVSVLAAWAANAASTASYFLPTEFLAMFSMLLATVDAFLHDWFSQLFEQINALSHYLLDQWPAVVFGYVLASITIYLEWRESPSSLLLAKLASNKSLSASRWKKAVQQSVLDMESEFDNRGRLQAATFFLSTLWFFPDALDSDTRESALEFVRQITQEQPQGDVTSSVRRQLVGPQTLSPPV